MKLQWDSIQWGEYAPGHFQHYISWAPNWLPKELRHIGIKRMWHDGPHLLLGFWYFNIGWSTPYTLGHYDFLTDEGKARWKNKPHWYRKFFDMTS